MAKMLKTLTFEMVRLKMEQKQPSRPTQESGYRNPNQFRRPNNVPQILPRERKNQDDQKVLPPFQNNEVDEEEDEDDTEEDPVVHLNDSESFPLHVTQQDYEDALIANQFEEGDEDEIVQWEPKRKINFSVFYKTYNKINHQIIKAEAVFSDDKGYYFAEPEKLQEILCFLPVIVFIFKRGYRTAGEEFVETKRGFCWEHAPSQKPLSIFTH
jgi:hypothetical protein